MTDIKVDAVGGDVSQWETGDEVAELLQSLGDDDGIVVSVYALGGKKMEWLFDLEPDVMGSSELKAHLRDEYGGGQFKVTVRRAGVFVKHKTLSVRAPKKLPVVANASGDKFAEAMLMLQQSQQQQAQHFQQMLQQMAVDSKQQQIDMMKLMLGKESQPTDVIGILSIAKDLFSKKDDSVTLLMKGIELHQQLSGKGGGDSGGLGDVLKSLGAPLAGLLASHQGMGAVAAPAPVAPVAPVEYGGGVSNNVDGVDEMAGEMQLRMGLAMLESAAKKGLGVGEWVTMFCDKFADNVPDEFILDKNMFQQVIGEYVDLTLHGEWFELFRVGCVEALFNDDVGDGPVASED